MDVDTIKEHVLKSPWVAQTIVQRKWPDEVHITVIEKTVAARWNQASLVSIQGEIFTPSLKSYPEGLPQLIGPDREHIAILEHYRKFSDLLSALHFKINRLELTPEHSWLLTLDNGMKLRGRYKDILTQMSHFVKVYPKVVGDRAAEVDYVDLRYSNGLAVRWKTIA